MEQNTIFTIQLNKQKFILCQKEKRNQRLVVHALDAQQ